MKNQLRLLALSIVVVVLGGALSATSASAVARAESCGGTSTSCGYCCYSEYECEQFCGQNCGGTCYLFENPSCCLEGLAIECA